jgi:hypothetical protein
LDLSAESSAFISSSKCALFSSFSCIAGYSNLVIVNTRLPMQML